jgi:regulator of replication initiation timing
MSLIGEGLELLGLLDKARNASLYKRLGDWIDKVRALQIENDHLLIEQKKLKEQLQLKGVPRQN